jgi:hypothetical protein
LGIGPEHVHDARTIDVPGLADVDLAAADCDRSAELALRGECCGHGGKCDGDQKQFAMQHGTRLREEVRTGDMERNRYRCKTAVRRRAERIGS